MTYEYSYDTYGALLNIDKKNDPQNILEKNPFRYRGYYYDTETGWYYLNSRYYDPVVKRFVSRDTAHVLAAGYGNKSQYNLFAYSLNDPIDNVDNTGHSAVVNVAKFAVGAFATGAAIAILAPSAPILAVAAGAAFVGATAIGGIYGYTTGGNGKMIDCAANGALDGYEVEVTYAKLKDGLIRISDAWVNSKAN